MEANRTAETVRKAYVTSEVAEVHLEPSDDASVMTRLYKRELVDVFEESGEWARVSHYYDHFCDGRMLARWIKDSCLGSKTPAPPKHGLPNDALGNALASSDDVERYWKRFRQGAKRAIERGLASVENFIECGGWIRSGTEGFYFVHTESHVRGRIYLHGPNGKMAQWHPWMDDKRVSEYLYQTQDRKCVLCEVPFPHRNLEVDHIVPKKTGRNDKLANLQLLCPPCNRLKGDRPMDWAVGQVRDLGIVRE